MSIPKICAALSLCLTGLVYDTALAEEGKWDFGGQASVEARYFPNDPAFPSQKTMTVSPSATLEPELVYELDGGNDRLNFSPFVRLDGNDQQRTHSDIRELNWLHLGSSWDFSAGVGKVFWGVTESVHLVDIINQTDAVEDISGEDKLGQPMLNLNLEQTWGTVNLFLLPGFRPRTFSANHARLHGSLPIDTDNPDYQSSQGSRHIDWATRWSKSFDNLDVAISHFQGTSREALFVLNHRGGQAVLTPFYKQIGQTGLELQITTDNTLWKAEAITRTGQGKRFFSTVTGFEHTLYGVGGSVADVGLLAEYLYDGRDPRVAPPTLADHDIFAGFRITMNDTQDTTLLLGVIWDHKTNAKLINLETEHRLTDHLKLEMKGRFFLNIPNTDPIAGIRNDDFMELKLNWFF